MRKQTETSTSTQGYAQRVSLIGKPCTLDAASFGNRPQWHGNSRQLFAGPVI